MHALVAIVQRLARHADGQDLIEYGLLVGLIAVVAIFAVTSVGSVVNGTLWNVVTTGLANAF